MEIGTVLIANQNENRRALNGMPLGWRGGAAYAAYGSDSRSVRAGRAAALGFEGEVPDWLTPRNGRQYGVCSVFDLVIPEREYEEAADVEIEHDYVIHLLDCVGAASPGNTLPGLYHAAPICSHVHRALILRAGRQTTRTSPTCLPGTVWTVIRASR